jgi:hypothetical protein
MGFLRMTNSVEASTVSQHILVGHPHLATNKIDSLHQFEIAALLMKFFGPILLSLSIGFVSVSSLPFGSAMEDTLYQMTPKSSISDELCQRFCEREMVGVGCNCAKFIQ